MTAIHPRSAGIVAAARTCIGTRFRAQGRTVGVALDCVGVALVAAAAVGLRVDLPAYSLHGDLEPAFDALLDAACTPLDHAETGAGDLLLVAPSPGRRHVGVVTDRGVVHAHATLGRVVEGPVDPAWTVIGAWRLPMED